MAMNFDIPDITENGEKAAAGGQRRKPRRIGAPSPWRHAESRFPSLYSDTGEQGRR